MSLKISYRLSVDKTTYTATDPCPTLQRYAVPMSRNGDIGWYGLDFS